MDLVALESVFSLIDQTLKQERNLGAICLVEERNYISDLSALISGLDGDGVGDLEGIRQRLDYLRWLMVDAIWISPFYPSPMADFGYDVSDYCGIDPLFGSLADFGGLLLECHQRGLKVIIDFVPNHTSDEHPWFPGKPVIADQ